MNNVINKINMKWQTLWIRHYLSFFSFLLHNIGHVFLNTFYTCFVTFNYFCKIENSLNMTNEIMVEAVQFDFYHWYTSDTLHVAKEAAISKPKIISSKYTWENKDYWWRIFSTWRNNSMFDGYHRIFNCNFQILSLFFSHQCDRPK